MMKRAFVPLLEKRLRERSPRPQVILGPRQVGKTTGLQQVMKAWAGPCHYASADDTLAQTGAWVQTQWQIALGKGTGVVLFLDEAQKIDNWAETVKRLWDAEGDRPRLKLVVSGSSSLTIQKGLTESLAGRFEVIPVFHWNYLETRAAFGCSLETYLKVGGYPGAHRYARDYPRWFSYVKSAILDRVIDLDILRHQTVAKPALFRQTFEILCGYPAQEVSYTKLLGQLQDKGNTDLIKRYIELYEGAFLFKALPKYSPRHLSVKTSSPKIIPLCPALHSLAAGPEATNDPTRRGHVFEAVVGADLFRLASDTLCYWRDGQDEIDFVLTIAQQVYGIEVKSGLKKSIRGRESFLNHFPGARFSLVTWDNYPSFAKAPLKFLEQTSIAQ
jgi:predicted AAA+ superfamily ATPase